MGIGLIFCKQVFVSFAHCRGEGKTKAKTSIERLNINEMSYVAMMVVVYNHYCSRKTVGWLTISFFSAYMLLFLI